MSKCVDRKMSRTYFMSAENVSDIKLCPSKLAENYFGHILCRQKICLGHIGQITTLAHIYFLLKNKQTMPKYDLVNRPLLSSSY